jgi:O-acetyl-ADP-ribose deacetylase (regulator of RNase III)
MIHLSKGSIFDTEAEALVNPVNCVGVMGAGLALEFRRRFPRNYLRYRNACANGILDPGGLLWSSIALEEDLRNVQADWVLNFATKLHWRDSSKLEYIENGLKELAFVLKGLEIGSVAVPALGCGLGGLNWADVKALTYEHLDKVPETVYLFEHGPKIS